MGLYAASSFVLLVGERQIFADEVERHETRKGAWHLQEVPLLYYGAASQARV